MHFLLSRIERLWRDVWMGATQVFYHIFRMLEEEGYLDLTNTTHFFCLHYVFLPRLQLTLDLFRGGWDNHPLRTEQNMTPNQLWELGQIQHPIPDPEVGLRRTTFFGNVMHVPKDCCWIARDICFALQV